MDSILYATADNPVPENHFAGFLEARGGVKIRYAVFRSKEREAKGTVVLLQGRSECIEKYYETINDLTARGLWVATFDWRGQAGSGRLISGSHTGHVARFADYEADLSLFLERIVLPDARLPFFIVAHSTGALVALSQAPFLENRIERMVLAAPFVALGGQSMSQRRIAIIARLASMTGLGNRNSYLSRLEALQLSDHPGVIIMDINDLKEVNDCHGHLKGDELIIETGRLVNEVFGDSFEKFRIGGDEFAFLTQNKTAQYLEEHIWKFNKKLSDLNEKQQIPLRWRLEPINTNRG